MIVPRPPTAEDQARDEALRRREWELTEAGKRRGPLDIWHRVGQPGEPIFRHGWGNVNTGVGLSPLSFLKSQDGFCHLRGTSSIPANGEPRE